MKTIGCSLKLKHLSGLLIVTTILIGSSFLQPAQASVWESKEKWSADWELKYREWVKREWNKNYFTKPGPLKNLVFDCADTVYTMRAIFSRENGLPFVIKDPTTSQPRTISNDMIRFDSMEPDLRFRSFIKLIMNTASTATLPNDTYPTAINRDALSSGSILTTDRLSHHSYTIHSFTDTGVPHLIFGSRPAATVLWERIEYPSVAFIFPAGIRPESNAGFRNFRWPEDIEKKVYDVPGYSLEQYQLTGSKWSKLVQKKMQQIEETLAQRLARVLSQACQSAVERIAIVKNAIALNESIGGRCMNATEYDDHSTPNRDGRMRSNFEDLADAYKEAENTGIAKTLDPKLKLKVEAVLAGAKGSSVAPVAAMSYCPIEIEPGRTLSLGSIYEYSIAGKLSNNPHDPLEVRWGLAKGPSAKARSCPVY